MLLASTPLVSPHSAVGSFPVVVLVESAPPAPLAVVPLPAPVPPVEEPLVDELVLDESLTAALLLLDTPVELAVPSVVVVDAVPVVLAAASVALLPVLPGPVVPEAVLPVFAPPAPVVLDPAVDEFSGLAGSLVAPACFGSLLPQAIAMNSRLQLDANCRAASREEGSGTLNMGSPREIAGAYAHAASPGIDHNFPHAARFQEFLERYAGLLTLIAAAERLG